MEEEAMASDLRSNVPKEKLIVRNDSLAKSFKGLFKDKETSDITLVVGGTQIPAHKAVLSARSQYFKAMLFNGMLESKEKEIDIRGQGDLTASVFEPILYYMYTGEMNMASKDSDLIKAILGEAAFFDLTELIDEVIAYLRRSHKDNSLKWAFDILGFASTYQNNALKEECYKELELDPDKAIQMVDEISKLSLNVIKELLSRRSFWAKEKLIFQTVSKFIHAQCYEVMNCKDLDGPKTVNYSLTRYVALPNLSADDLLGDVRKSNLFSSEAILDALTIKRSEAKKRFPYLRGILGCPPGKVLGQGVNATESFVNNGPHFENIKSGVMIAGTTFCFSLKAQTITDALLIVLPKEAFTPGQRWSFALDLLIAGSEDDDDQDKEEDNYETVVDFKDYSLNSHGYVAHYNPCAIRKIQLTIALNPEEKITLTADQVLVCPLFYQILGRYGCFDDNDNLLFSEERCCRKLVRVFAPPNQRDQDLISNGSLDHTLESGFSRHDIIVSDDIANSSLFKQRFILQRPHLQEGVIIISLGAPTFISSFRFLLPTGGLPIESQPCFQYQIFISKDCINWDRIADNSQRECRGWQTVRFQSTPLMYIMFQGTDSSLTVSGTKIFGIVQFEFPAPPPAEEVAADDPRFAVT